MKIRRKTAMLIFGTYSISVYTYIFRQEKNFTPEKSNNILSKLTSTSETITKLEIFLHAKTNKTIIGNIYELSFPSSCFDQNRQPICTNFMVYIIFLFSKTYEG